MSETLFTQVNCTLIGLWENIDTGFGACPTSSGQGLRWPALIETRDLTPLNVAACDSARAGTQKGAMESVSPESRWGDK